MTKYALMPASDLKPGASATARVAGRDLVIFNVDGAYHALLDRCPHQGAKLSAGCVTGFVLSDEPGDYRVSRLGEVVRCPWHGWEFDVTTGQSWYNPKRMRVPVYPAAVERGDDLVKGPYVAETFPVSVEEDYIVVEIGAGKTAAAG